MAPPIRVLIVEDHRVLAEGLAFTLDSETDFEIVGLVGSVTEAVEQADQLQPDVALLDYHLPDGTGAQAATAIRERSPHTATLMLTGDTSDEALLAAVEAGACGFLRKSQAVSDVAGAVRRAAEGEMLIPAATLAGLLSRQRERARQDAERAALAARLTRREHEVLRLMAQGRDNRAIAQELAVSITTVRGYVREILTTLGAHSRLEAAVRASELGLLE